MPFDTTTWSLILRVNSTEPQIAGPALEQLCQDYWAPLYSWLRYSGKSEDEALDLVQGFFEYAIKSGLFKKADPAQGRLRNFLLASLKNYVCKEIRKEQAEKRGGHIQIISLSEVEVANEEAFLRNEKPSEHSGSPVVLFEKRWAITLLERASGRLAERYSQKGKQDLFQAMKPFLYGQPPSSAREAAAMGLSLTVNGFNVSLAKMRKQYRECVEEEVALTLTPEESLEEEMAYLYQLLSGGDG